MYDHIDEERTNLVCLEWSSSDPRESGRLVHVNLRAGGQTLWDVVAAAQGPGGGVRARNHHRAPRQSLGEMNRLNA